MPIRPVLTDWSERAAPDWEQPPVDPIEERSLETVGLKISRDGPADMPRIRVQCRSSNGGDPPARRQVQSGIDEELDEFMCMGSRLARQIRRR